VTSSTLKKASGWKSKAGFRNIFFLCVIKCRSCDLSHLEDDSGWKSKPGAIFRKMLQTTNGKKLFLMKIRRRWLVEAAFCLSTMLVIKNDDKSQITAFFVFLFKETYTKGSCVSLCMCSTSRYLQHIRKKNLSSFWLQTTMPSSGWRM
jgi:hypothetical protein